jgi:DNA mismatch endonuclease (patch repair protein)
MTDVLTPAQRRLNMSRIRGVDTKPEMIVRRLVHGMGYRYSLHGKRLPGKPDLVLTRHRKIIFVHGCYWHRHNCRYGSVRAQTRSEFWDAKISGNQARDRRNGAALKKMDWRVLVVWECEIRNLERLKKRLIRFLSD